MEEGAQSYVGRVNITGNVRTKDKVVRRELALAPGDLFNTVRMDASKQILNNLLDRLNCPNAKAKTAKKAKKAKTPANAERVCSKG